MSVLVSLNKDRMHFWKVHFSRLLVSIEVKTPPTSSDLKVHHWQGIRVGGPVAIKIKRDSELQQTQRQPEMGLCHLMVFYLNQCCNMKPHPHSGPSASFCFTFAGPQRCEYWKQGVKLMIRCSTFFKSRRKVVNRCLVSRLEQSCPKCF